MLKCWGRRKMSAALAAGLMEADEGLARRNTPFHAIPGPPSLPLIGRLKDYSSLGRYGVGRLHERHLDLHRQYGDICREKLLGREIVHVFSREIAQEVFMQEGRYPGRTVIEPDVVYRTGRGIPLGLLNLQDAEWHRLRRLAQDRILRPAVQSAVLHNMDNIAQEFVMRTDMLRDPGSDVMERNYKDELHLWSLESIARLAFGIRAGCLGMDLTENSDAMQLVRSTQMYFRCLGKLIFSLPLYKVVPTPTWRSMASAQDTFVRLSENYIRQAWRNAEHGDPGTEDSLLFHLLKKSELSKEEVGATITDLFQGGIDTTTNGMMYSLFALAKNPEVQDLVYREIRTHLPEGAPVTPEVLRKMKYLKAVIKETLRLWPVIFGNPRLYDYDVVLGGYDVPAKTEILVHHRVMCRQERYFTDPLTFDPTRWLRDENTSPVPPYLFMPFGHGVRMCIGRRFAEQQLQLLIIRILQRFHVECQEAELGQVFSLVLLPDRNPRFVFRRRQGHTAWAPQAWTHGVGTTGRDARRRHRRQGHTA
ncbi:PREDICTED: cytochrome P450 27C1-like isoform X2 [Branchiostoma belcheri]|nr:PREDICTED: cytochrome P450 27C1-like isoform X2 [Branchiostoma belcheri]